MQHLTNVDSEWQKFISCNNYESENEKIIKSTLQIPKCSPIYISTKTMITYLNTEVDLVPIFWKIRIMPYQCARNGVIKKQIKMTSFSKSEVETINSHLDDEIICSSRVISEINNPKLKVPFKYVQKINVGVSKKELISYRSKERGAFYNCFALIFRILYKGEFKEVHVKVFNTGKLEIPGIQSNDLLFKTLDELLKILRPHINTNIQYNNTKMETVLINSNFKCGYFIDRYKLHSILKNKYNTISIFDPCSYPGIQSKFYYNAMHEIQNGVCSCSKKCEKGGSGNGDGECMEISFMIFRTGSILIVGHCDEPELHIVYAFLEKLFLDEFYNINDGLCDVFKQPKKTKKIKTKKIIVSL